MTKRTASDKDCDSCTYWLEVAKDTGIGECTQDDSTHHGHIISASHKVCGCYIVKGNLN